MTEEALSVTRSLVTAIRQDVSILKNGYLDFVRGFANRVQ